MSRVDPYCSLLPRTIWKMIIAGATSFTNKNQHATSSKKKSARNMFHEKNWFNWFNQCTSCTKRKINMQQVSRNKSQHATGFMNRKLHVTTSMNKINITRTKINVQISWREKSTSNKFQEQKISTQQVPQTNKKYANATSSRNEISFTRRIINVRVLRREKSKCNKFHGQKSVSNKFLEQNQHATSYMNELIFTRIKINIQVVRMEK